MRLPGVVHIIFTDIIEYQDIHRMRLSTSRHRKDEYSGVTLHPEFDLQIKTAL